MKNCMCFIKGMGLGIVVGVATVAMCKHACQNNRRLRHKTKKTAKAMSDIMEDLGNLIG